MIPESTPKIVGIGAVFIDDIVLPTGKTYMGQLGGGVVHALMGAALWDERPGIISLTGYDLPESVRGFLEQHLDTSGIHQLNIQQMRAWQLFEEDGSRRELYRTSPIEPFTQGAQPEHFPSAYKHCRAFYLLQGFEGIRAWCHSISGLIFWEPLQQVMVAGAREQLRGVLQSCDIQVVSPNLREAQAVYGDLPPDDLITLMFEDGACDVVLRMGENGSLVASKTTDERHYIHALTVPEVIDQTGAGNTFCGAFLLGLARGKSLREAAFMGTVAASFCIEQTGVLNPSLVNRSERDSRLETIVGHDSR